MIREKNAKFQVKEVIIIVSDLDQEFLTLTLTSIASATPPHSSLLPPFFFSFLNLAKHGSKQQ